MYELEKFSNDDMAWPYQNQVHHAILQGNGLFHLSTIISFDIPESKLNLEYSAIMLYITIL